jgi:hypothetical protein
MTRQRARNRRPDLVSTEQLARTHGDRPDGPIDSEIRQRAYEIYTARGGWGSSGDAVSDWLQAEQELRQGGRVGGLSPASGSA